MGHEAQVQFRFQTGHATDVGRVRRTNEDRYMARPDLGLWAVADGMGGHAGGEFASATVVEALDSIGRPVSAADLLARVEDRLIKANERLRQEAAGRGGVIGSTLAALLVHERHYGCLWSGDSRVYRLRAGQFEQLTRDHSEIQDLVDSGAITAEEARRSPQRNVITRAIGVAPEAELELVQGALEAGDRFLLCSDGLYDPVDGEELAGALGSASPQAACDSLIALALDRGATDNVTVVIVLCEAG